MAKPGVVVGDKSDPGPDNTLATVVQGSTKTTVKGTALGYIGASTDKGPISTSPASGKTTVNGSTVAIDGASAGAWPNIHATNAGNKTTFS